MLDEATSALDDASDRSIRAALEPVMRSATTLVITHRAVALGSVDRVLELRDGRVVEQGD